MILIETGLAWLNIWGENKMYRIVTNNQLCLRKYGAQISMEYLEEGSYLDVLYKVRDYLHLGWKLETHPMTGSLKPNQTPFKSIMISNDPLDQEEFFTQEMTISNAISACMKFQSIKKTPDWPESICEDFRIVDLSLIEGAIQRIL